MRLPLHSRWRMKGVFVMAITTSAVHAALVNPVDPLGYSEALDFNPILHMREVQCPANFFSCEDKGEQFIGACCENGQQCSLDAHQSAACCPDSATCTGVVPGEPTASPSFVSNSYFPFPVVPTTYPNPSACTSALNDCHNNYDACVNGLAGGNSGYGVTIDVPGAGGTTVAQAKTIVPSATATEICSTLSLQACHGLSGGACHAGTHGAIIVGTANAAPRQTAACMAGVIAAGVGLGLINGQL